MNDSDRADALRVVEAELQQLLRHVRRQVTHAAERLSPGLPPTAYIVISTIARLGPVSPSQLIDVLEIDKGLLSRTISQLDRAGLVDRSSDPIDGRRTLLTVAPTGERRLADIRDPADDPLASATASWTTADLRRFADLLHALTSVSGPRGGSPADETESRATAHAASVRREHVDVPCGATAHAGDRPEGHRAAQTVRRG